MRPAICDQILIVGEWPCSMGGWPAVGRVAHEFCKPTETSFARAARQRTPSWLLLAVADERCLVRLADRARSLFPASSIAVLGSPHDLDRCERWVQRGARVYASEDAGADRLLTLMTAARELEAVVVDHCFTRLRLQARRALLDDLGASTVKLSKRETEVLSLIESGLTNNEIASRDGLSINTVESCIRRLSGKIGARNRVDAVRRAKLLGF